LRVKVILLPKNEAGILYNRGGAVCGAGRCNFEKDSARRRPDRVTPRHIGHVFAGVTRAGAASERPYEEKSKCDGQSKANADPSPLKGIRDDSVAVRSGYNRIDAEKFMNSWRTAVSRARLTIIICTLLAGGAAWIGLRAQDKPAQDPAPPAAPPANGIITRENVAYRFAYAGNVAQIPLENVSGRMLMPVRVNAGKPGFFLVATGGPRTVLDPKPWLPQDAAAATQIDFEKTLFSLAGLDMQVANLIPASLVDFSDQVGQPVRGVLGADVLRQFVIEIEYDRSAIHFYDANSFEYEGKGMKLPLIMRGGLPSIHMKIALEGHGSFEDDFAVETETASTVAISKPYAVAHHIREKKLKGFWRVDANGEKTLLTRVKSIAIGPFVFEEPIVEFPPAAGPDNSGSSIGNGLLSRFRIFLDQPHQQVILETGENYKSNFETDMSGVVLVARGANLKSFEVAAVTPHSPGSEAGLQKGDVIAGIDGQPAADLDLSGVRELFRVFGHEYHLTVVRNEHTVEMKMRTKRLV
jgi:hypothetical protein